MDNQLEQKTKQRKVMESLDMFFISLNRTTTKPRTRTYDLHCLQVISKKYSGGGKDSFRGETAVGKKRKFTDQIV